MIAYTTALRRLRKMPPEQQMVAVFKDQQGQVVYETEPHTAGWVAEQLGGLFWTWFEATSCLIRTGQDGRATR